MLGFQSFQTSDSFIISYDFNLEGVEIAFNSFVYLLRIDEQLRGALGYQDVGVEYRRVRDIPVSAKIEKPRDIRKSRGQEVGGLGSLRGQPETEGEGVYLGHRLPGRPGGAG